MTKKIQLSKAVLVKKYFEENKSLKKIADELNLGVGTVYRNFKRQGIKTKNISDYNVWNKDLTCFDDKRILNGNQHPRWKDKTKYYVGYKLIKRTILPCKCDKCDNIAVLLHHIDGDTRNNELFNLLPLCRCCHTRLHNKQRRNFKPGTAENFKN
jgi:IS30 family transposase